MKVHFTWRDITAIAIVILAVGLAITMFNGLFGQTFESWRLAIIGLFVLGMGMLVTLGPTSIPEGAGWSIAGIILSVLGFGLGIIGIIAANATMFLLLFADLLLLWAIVVPTHLVHGRIASHHTPRHI